MLQSERGKYILMFALIKHTVLYWEKGNPTCSGGRRFWGDERKSRVTEYSYYHDRVAAGATQNKKANYKQIAQLKGESETQSE